MRWNIGYGRVISHFHYHYYSSIFAFLLTSVAPVKGGDNFFGTDSSNGSQTQTTSLSYSSPQQQNFSNASNESGEQLTMMNSVQNTDDFKSGDFVVSRLEVFQEWPPLWRVDGKTLLQKFEPFNSNNKTIYRSISTVSAFDYKQIQSHSALSLCLCLFLCDPPNRKTHIIFSFGSMQHGRQIIVVSTFWQSANSSTNINMRCTWN